MSQKLKQFEKMSDEEIRKEMQEAGREVCDCEHMLKNHTFDLKATEKSGTAVSNGCKYCDCRGFH